MKYYIYQFNKNSGFLFKRTKCSDYWTRNFSLCWQFSKQGAKAIADRMNECRRNNFYVYGIVSVDNVEQMLSEYDNCLDKTTFMEDLNERPYWI